MANQPTKIVLTGASSNVGKLLAKRLSMNKGMEISGLCSPRTKLPDYSKQSNVNWLCHDLTTPITGEVAETLRGADYVLHLAWARGRHVANTLELNRQIVNNLLQNFKERKHFIFFSSVAASPKALSNYGKTKYTIMTEVETRGGTSLVCGLITSSPPFGPYKLLSNLIYKTPLQLRFLGGGPRAYLVCIEDVFHAIEALVGWRSTAGTYRLCTKIISMNEFLAGLEGAKPPRKLCLNLDEKKIISLCRLAHKYHAPFFTIFDKILTFLYKDVEYLDSLTALPSQEFSRDGYTP